MAPRPLWGVLWCLVLLGCQGGSAASLNEGEVSELQEDGGLQFDARPDPKQVHLEKPIAEHLPGKPMKSVGFPKQRVVQGPESKHMHDELAGDRNKPNPDRAHDKVYPGGGQMSAADVRELMNEVSPLVNNAKAGQEAEERLADEKAELSAQKMKFIADQVSGGVEGEELLSGAIPQQLGIVKGNLGNCMRKLLTCKFYKKSKTNTVSDEDLGESQSPEKSMQDIRSILPSSRTASGEACPTQLPILRLNLLRSTKPELRQKTMYTNSQVGFLLNCPTNLDSSSRMIEWITTSSKSWLSTARIALRKPRPCLQRKLQLRRRQLRMQTRRR